MRVARSLRLATSQILRVWSSPAETIQVPSELTAQAFTRLEWLGFGAAFSASDDGQVKVPPATSQIFRVSTACCRGPISPRSSGTSSSLAETIQVPSGLTAQAVTELVWPVRVARFLPLATSQILRVWSALAETIQVP